MMEITTDNSLTRKNVAVLVAAQAVLGSQMPMIFVIGGLAGGMLEVSVREVWFNHIPK